MDPGGIAVHNLSFIALSIPNKRVDPGGIEPPFRDCQPRVLPLNDGPTTWYYIKAMSYLKQKALLFIVFVTGACVLILEVTAIRILSPFFGNTIYSYSSILSVILGALSFGYYFGGKYADTHPVQKSFYGIIMLSGATVFFMELLIITFVPQFAYSLQFTSGPLVVSCILFALPSFLLGTLSPYAIKLQSLANPKEGVGELSGQVFFFSTMGSIAGSLLTGFFLIPNFGVQTIILATGGILLTIGATGYLLYDGDKKKAYSIVIISLAFISAILSIKDSQASGVAYQTDGVYEKLLVYDTKMRDRGTRILMQDRSASSAIDKENGNLVFEYAQYYSIYKLLRITPQRALFLGAGAYTFPNAILKDSPNAEVDIVDVEPKLYDIAKTYFGLENLPRMHNINDDGRKFLHNTTKSYDYIYSDVYGTVYSIPPHMTTKEYFELVESRLSKNGIVLANIIGSLDPEVGTFTFSEMRTFLEVFPNSYFFAVNSPNTKEIQNIVFVGVNGDAKLDLGSDALVDAITQTSIPVREHLIDFKSYHLERYNILTDNYAPVEYYTSKLLKAQFTPPEKGVNNIDGKTTLALIQSQVDFGPRYLGNGGHDQVVKWLDEQLSAISKENTIKQVWKQKGMKSEYSLTNFIFRINPQNPKRVIVGTHYDTLKHSVDGGKPIPGANNGASGTAVMLSVIQSLTTEHQSPSIGIDFVFFDAEEGDPDIPPGVSGWEPLGSAYFGEHLSDYYKIKNPGHMVDLDLVCAKDAKFYYETNSLHFAENQTKGLWEIGASIDSQMFLKQPRYAVLDDHTTLQKYGIPGSLVIDFGYPEIHSTTDTIDKCSSETLEKVGNTLLEYINSF